MLIRSDELLNPKYGRSAINWGGNANSNPLLTLCLVAHRSYQVVKDAWNVPFLSRASGSGTGDAELLAIGGDAGNVFEVADFDLLDGKLDHSRDLGNSCA